MAKIGATQFLYFPGSSCAIVIIISSLFFLRKEFFVELPIQKVYNIFLSVNSSMA